MSDSEELKVAQFNFTKENLELLEMCLHNQEMRELEDIQNGDDECICVYKHILHIRKVILESIKELS